MTTTTSCTFVTASPESTRALAAGIGRLAQPSLVITLTGDLGSGKTCFVQGLAQGLRVPADHYVTSPSYTSSTPIRVVSPSTTSTSIASPVVIWAISAFWTSWKNPASRRSNGRSA